jgi:hypothetical protein
MRASARTRDTSWHEKLNRAATGKCKPIRGAAACPCSQPCRLRFSRQFFAAVLASASSTAAAQALAKL